MFALVVGAGWEAVILELLFLATLINQLSTLTLGSTCSSWRCFSCFAVSIFHYLFF